MTEQVAPLIGTSAISFLLSFMLMRVWLPFAPKRGGEILMQVPVGLPQKVMIYRSQAALVLLAIIAASIPGRETSWLLPGTQQVALLAMLIIVSLPLRYVFYDRGVALSNGVPRSYKTFQKLNPQDIRQGKRWLLAKTTTVVLRGRKTQRGYEPGTTLYLPSEQSPTVVRLLRKHVR